MLGYLGGPPAPADLLTQELGRMDASGNLTVVGRLSELLNFRGNRVGLTGIEALVSSLDGVEDCVVVPADADDAPADFHVRLTTGADAQAVESAIRREVRPVGIVGSVIVVAATPRTASGKLRRGRS
jgi:acyl-coenzyme A synthetase/AMP-(fatty) acid ligase